MCDAEKLTTFVTTEMSMAYRVGGLIQFMLKTKIQFELHSCVCVCDCEMNTDQLLFIDFSESQTTDRVRQAPLSNAMNTRPL